jgi:hypothetical protein
MDTKKKSFLNILRPKGRIISVKGTEVKQTPNPKPSEVMGNKPSPVRMPVPKTEDKSINSNNEPLKSSNMPTVNSVFKHVSGATASTKPLPQPVVIYNGSDNSIVLDLITSGGETITWRIEPGEQTPFSVTTILPGDEGLWNVYLFW